jgi:ring-1,2-phenylacetyl-CoA epoxidase subunit PaaC
LEKFWPLTVELFAEDDLDRAMADAGVAPRLDEARAAWVLRIEALLAEATLTRPADRSYSWFGKRGQHSEHLGYMLAEMQHLQRAHPGARW